MRSPIMSFIFRVGMIFFALFSILLASGLAEGGVAFLPGIVLLALCCAFTWALFQISMPSAHEAKTPPRTSDGVRPSPPVVVSHPTGGHAA